MVKIIPAKHFKTNEEFQTFIDNEQEWMYERIVEAINEAHFSSQDYADILKAKISDTKSVISIKADRSDWKTSLDLAIKWYIDKEQYEKCAEISNLLKEIFSTNT